MWITQWLMCPCCSHFGVHVYPAECTVLECPRCKRMSRVAEPE